MSDYVDNKLVEHYKSLYERHARDSNEYQAQLYHAYRSLAQQQKGLKRQARKIKRLQQRLNELTAPKRTPQHDAELITETFCPLDLLSG